MGGTSLSGFTLWVHSKEFDLKFMPENWFHYLSNLLRKPTRHFLEKWNKFLVLWQSEYYSELYSNIYFKFTPNIASCIAPNIVSKLTPYIASNIILNGSLNISPKITPNITPNFIRNLQKFYKISFKYRVNAFFLNCVTPKIITNSKIIANSELHTYSLRILRGVWILSVFKFNLFSLKLRILLRKLSACI